MVIVIVLLLCNLRFSVGSFILTCDCVLIVMVIANVLLLYVLFAAKVFWRLCSRTAL